MPSLSRPTDRGPVVLAVVAAFAVGVAGYLDASLVPLAFLVAGALLLRALVRRVVTPGDTAWMSALVLGAFFLRAVAAAALFSRSMAQGGEGFFTGDDQMYAQASWHIVRYVRGDPDPAFVPPEWGGEYYVHGTFVFIETALFSLFGPHALVMIIVDVALAAATILFVADAARRLFGARAAMAAAVVLAVWPSLVLWSAINLRDTMVVFFIVLAAWCVHRYPGRRPALWLAGALIAVWGEMDLRPFVMQLLAVAVPVAIALHPAAQSAMRRSFATGAAAIVGAALLLHSGSGGYVTAPLDVLRQVEIIRNTMSVGRTAFVPLPTATPEPLATTIPTTEPTTAPTVAPTVAPTTVPTVEPTTAPTIAPNGSPTTIPTTRPTTAPTTVPTTAPTVRPTTAPTTAPTTVPAVVRTTTAPTTVPTVAPTQVATTRPTTAPTSAPTTAPTTAPGQGAGGQATTVPTTVPTSFPTTAPTTAPTTVETVAPTVVPTTAPISVVTIAPVDTTGPAAVTPAPEEAIGRGTLAHLPRGLLYTLLAPFPWAVGSLSDLAALPEMLAWYVVVAAGLATLWIERARWRAFVVEALFVGAAILVFALAEGNVGTLFRHRAMVIPLGVLVASPRVAALARRGLVADARRAVERIADGRLTLPGRAARRVEPRRGEE